MLTHNDLDAAGSIIVAKLFSLKIDKYLFCNYSDIYDENNDKVILDIDPEITRVFMPDLACNMNMYNFLKEQGLKYFSILWREL
jgi:poly(3-hydroxyalkanoate) synthetase